MDIDTSELRAFVADLESASGTIPTEVRAVVKKAAGNLKEDYAEQAYRSAHFRSLGRTVSYDMSGNAYYSEAEVGPDRSRGRGAGLAGFFLGWPNGGGGSGDLDTPLEREGAAMIEWIGRAVEGAL